MKLITHLKKETKKNIETKTIKKKKKKDKN